MAAQRSARRLTPLLIGALSILAGLALPVAAVAAETAPTRTLYLVRHGEYDHDDPRDEAVGKALVPLGIAQARAIGDRLRGLPVEFTSFLASPLTRARETALVIGEQLGGRRPEIVADLAECTPPTRRQDIMENEKAEDLAACKAQLERLAARLLAPPTAPGHELRELIVAHGNVIRYLVVRALDVDPEAWLGMTVGNASLTTITIRANGTRMISGVGDLGHLSPGLQSGLSGTPPRALAVPPAGD